MRKERRITIEPRGYDRASFSRRYRIPIFISATDIKDYLKCPRMVYFKKLCPTEIRLKELNVSQVLGEFEHKCFEILNKELMHHYLNLSRESQVTQDYIQSLPLVVSAIVEKVKNEFMQKFFVFDSSIAEHSIELKQRLIKLEEIRLNQAKILLQKGISGLELVSHLFPVQTEVYLNSQDLGLSGRIDAIYNNGSGLCPEDIKTYIPTNGDGVDLPTQLQLAVYALLIENSTGKDVNIARVNYSKLGKIETIILTSELRKKVLRIRDQILKMILQRKEPKPHKKDTFCEFCNPERKDKELKNMEVYEDG